MNKIEKIKAEIEFRIAQWQQYTFACASQIASEAIDRIDELKGLLAFIDSLQDEPKKLRAGKGSYKWLEEQQQFEDIKAELNKLLTECEVDPEAEYVYRSMLLLVARHFTEWQKEQMMKDAINAHVFKSYNPVSESPDKSCRGIELLYEYENSNENIPYVKAGDNIKFIIIKDNE